MTTDDYGRPIVNDVPVYARLAGGVLHVMTRAVDKATFDFVAEEVGLLVRETTEDDQEIVRVSSGNTITRIGPHVLVQGTYDVDGNELTPPVFDTRYHVNFWLGTETVERGEWVTWIEQWMLNGTLAEQNKSEVALKYQGIELIDPVSIQTPSNVLL